MVSTQGASKEYWPSSSFHPLKYSDWHIFMHQYIYATTRFNNPQVEEESVFLYKSRFMAILLSHTSDSCWQCPEPEWNILSFDRGFFHEDKFFLKQPWNISQLASIYFFLWRNLRKILAGYCLYQTQLFICYRRSKIVFKTFVILAMLHAKERVVRIEKDEKQGGKSSSSIRFRLPAGGYVWVTRINIRRAVREHSLLPCPLAIVPR